MRRPLIEARRAEREANREARLEAKRAAGRARYQATKERDREKRLERQRLFRARNPGYATSAVRKWRKENPEKRRAERKGRRGRKTKRLRSELMGLQRGRCAICRGKLPADVHIDHIMPLSKGGPNRRSNLQLTCAPCNLAKGAHHPVDFARSLGRLL